MASERTTIHSAPEPAEDPETLIRELRIRVGLLQSELEQVRREHAALKATIAQDIGALARRYLEPPKPASSVRHVDGVIFGGWDRPEYADDRIVSREDEPQRGPRSA